MCEAIFNVKRPLEVGNCMISVCADDDDGAVRRLSKYSAAATQQSREGDNYTFVRVCACMMHLLPQEIDSSVRELLKEDVETMELCYG